MRARLALLVIGVLATVCGLALLVGLRNPALGQALTPLGNVTWFYTDSIAGCPAGDSLVAGHPSLLRILVTYRDNNDLGRNGVPPESIWVTYAKTSGNIIVNDQIPSKIYADDSTRSGGSTRIFFPTVAGCGKLDVTLHVSGVDEGTKTITIRTADSSATARVTLSDTTHVCDLNYDGSINQSDRSLTHTHYLHWHREALHGGMVQRTSYCDTCADEQVGDLGESTATWSPNGKWVTYTAFVAAGSDASCKVFIVPSDPANGNTVRQITSTPLALHDYFPGWLPDGKSIVFARTDSVIIKKGVKGFSSDTTDHAVTAGDCGIAGRGDDLPSVSPDGQWIAFSRCNRTDVYISSCGRYGPGGYSIWKIPIGGGTAKRLTTLPDSCDAPTDIPNGWSPDGRWLFFQRSSGNHPYITIFKVSADSGAVDSVLVPPDTSDAQIAQVTTDSLAMVLCYGKRATGQRLYGAAVTDPVSSGLPIRPQYVIGNYPDFNVHGGQDIFGDQIAPDGTRLLITTRNVFAARRNMSLPPQFTSVGGAVNDTTAIVGRSADCGINLQFTVAASDPESDALTYSALFLPSGATFNPSTRTFSWTPSGSDCGKTATVKFIVTTPSGGSDAVLCTITVGSGSVIKDGGPVSDEDVAGALPRITVVGPNPTRGVFAIATAAARKGTAAVTVYDLTGRVVTVLHGQVGKTLSWDGRTSRGQFAGNGVYFYRARIPGLERTGQFVVLR